MSLDPSLDSVARSVILKESAMGLFDTVKGALGQVEAAAVPALINAALAKTNLGDLNGLLTQLQQGGLASQVQSWLGSGQNLSVTADQLRAALGNEQVRQLAQHFGLPVDQVLDLLSQHLPTVIDQASPKGTLQAA
jgi:uncharacterized protein YidB (DUF937 family)